MLIGAGKHRLKSFLKKKKKKVKLKGTRNRNREAMKEREATSRAHEERSRERGRTANSASILPSLQLNPTKIPIITTFESPIYTYDPKLPTPNKPFLLLCLFLRVEAVFFAFLNSQNP